MRTVTTDRPGTATAPDGVVASGPASEARAPWLAVVATGVAVLAAALWGHAVARGGTDLVMGAPPLVGRWDLRPSAWVLLTLAAAPLCLVLARRAAALPWRRAVWSAGAVCALWATSLALSDGPDALTAPLARPDEYLVAVPDVGPGFLPGFADRVLTDGRPGQWPTHVGGHPPGFLLVLALLARVGLGGPWPAAVLVVAVGASAAAAAAVATRAVAGEATARAALPFLVLLPGAVWLAVSADAFFLGVTAWGLALLAVGGTARAAAGGLLLGAGLFLTYGVLPLGVLALALLLRRGAATARRELPAAAAGVLVVVTAFAVGGFWWFEGLQRTLARVADGEGGQRPVGYFLVANLVAFSLATGPAALAGTRRVVRRAQPHADALRRLVVPGLAAVALAEVSLRSKGEVERIWLLFVPWVLVSAARLPHPRRWLAAQVTLAVTVQLSLRSTW